MSKAVPNRIVEQTDTYVEVARRYPLWAALPAEQRLTAEAVRRAHGVITWRSYYEELLARIESPGCPVATKVTGYSYQVSGLYAPCPYPVADGETFCGTHGGGSAARVDTQTKAALRAERDALAAELAALKAAR